MSNDASSEAKVRWQRWAVLILAGLLLYVVRGILAPFVIAAILAYVLSPLVELITARGLPRALAATIVFLAALAPLVLAGFLLGPGLARQTRELVANGPDLVENVLIQVMGDSPIELFGAEVTPHTLGVRVTASIRDSVARPMDAFHAAEQIIQVVLHTVLALLALFYFLLDGPRLAGYLLRFVPPEERPHLLVVLPRIHRVLGRFLGGQMVLVALMSAVTFVVLHFILHLRFALPIAIVSGFLEIIPVIGPVTAGAIACVVAVGQDGLVLALWVALAYFVLRQVEDQFVMPQVVGRVVHLHPLVTVFAVLAGETIAGVLGMILAVPLAASIRVVLDYVYPSSVEKKVAESTTPPSSE